MTTEEEYIARYEERQRRRRRHRAMWPIYGFFLAITFGVIGWFSSEPVIDWLYSTGRFSKGNLTDQQLQIAVTAIIFVILAGIAGLIIALAAPRAPTTVSEGQLAKERKKVIKEQELKKARRQYLARLEQERRRNQKQR